MRERGPLWKRSLRNAGFRSRRLRATAGSPPWVWIKIQPRRPVGDLQTAGVPTPGGPALGRSVLNERVEKPLFCLHFFAKQGLLDAAGGLGAAGPRSSPARALSWSFDHLSPRSMPDAIAVAAIVSPRFLRIVSTHPRLLSSLSRRGTANPYATAWRSALQVPSRQRQGAPPPAPAPPLLEGEPRPSAGRCEPGAGEPGLRAAGRGSA